MSSSEMTRPESAFADDERLLAEYEAAWKDETEAWRVFDAAVKRRSRVSSILHERAYAAARYAVQAEHPEWFNEQGGIRRFAPKNLRGEQLVPDQKTAWIDPSWEWKKRTEGEISRRVDAFLDPIDHALRERYGSIMSRREVEADEQP